MGMLNENQFTWRKNMPRDVEAQRRREAGEAGTSRVSISDPRFKAFWPKLSENETAHTPE